MSPSLLSMLEVQKEIVQEFARFNTWEDKYKYLMSLGKSLPPYPEDKRQDLFKVKGCQSQVWLFAEYKEGVMSYAIDSDALIVKGLAALLHRVYHLRTPSEVTQSSLDFLHEIGLTSHLSQSRSNGLSAMVRQFKNYAVAFSLLQTKK